MKLVETGDKMIRGYDLMDILAVVFVGYIICALLDLVVQFAIKKIKKSIKEYKDEEKMD